MSSHNERHAGRGGVAARPRTRRRVDTRLRLWLLLLATAFFGLFLAYATAESANATLDRSAATSSTSALVPLIGFVRSADAGLLDSLALAAFGAGLVIVGAVLRRAQSGRQPVTTMAPQPSFAAPAPVREAVAA